MDTKGQILSMLDEMGIYVEETNNRDIDLREYILDSIQFITLMVELENVFGVSFPDELLSIESLSSLNSFTLLIDTLKSEEKELFL